MSLEKAMRPQQLFVRCYAERKGDQWESFCLDLSLGAQGSSLDEVKAKLDEQIKELIFDALAGEDQDYADYLLHRKAPARFWLRYWYIRGRCKLDKTVRRSLAQKGNRPLPMKVPFREKVPLIPAPC